MDQNLTPPKLGITLVHFINGDAFYCTVVPGILRMKWTMVSKVGAITIPE
jgi:hypothetical protein